MGRRNRAPTGVGAGPRPEQGLDTWIGEPGGGAGSRQLTDGDSFVWRLDLDHHGGERDGSPASWLVMLSRGLAAGNGTLDLCSPATCIIVCWAIAQQLRPIFCCFY
jgi:hypothetical protein